MPQPTIVFQHAVFAKDRVKPKAGALIRSGEELRDAFERARTHPMWKNDPRLKKISPTGAKEVLKLYNAVVADGRYVRTLVEDPAKAAKALNIRIAPRNLELISIVGSNLGNSASPAGAVAVISIAVVAIAVTTAIVSSAADPRSRIVIDESGLVKI